MNGESIRTELKRIMEELRELQELVTEDCRMDDDRYNIGVLVEIGYACRELEVLLEDSN